MSDFFDKISTLINAQFNDLAGQETRDRHWRASS